jgi:hypothetical protein
MGKRIIWVPILLVIGFAIFTILLHILGVETVRLLSSGYELFLPIVTGVIVATTATQDAALELQLTMPKNYSNTSLVRLGLIVLWALIVGVLSVSIASFFKLNYVPQLMQPWSSPLQFLGIQLSWIVTTIWFVAVALVATLLTHSRSASSAILGVVWIIQVLFMGHIVDTTTWLRPLFLFPTLLAPQISYWTLNRLEVLATGIILLPIGWLLLHNTESLLKGSSEE